jgi:hypothetical protein
MREPRTLEAAMEMVDRFGVNAELQAGEEMDRALEVGDAGSFDKWRLIAETIAALSRRGPTVSIARDQSVARESFNRLPACGSVSSIPEEYP